MAKDSAPVPEYLKCVPAAANIPAGYILIHNRVRPARRGGVRGFRFWIEAPGAAGRVVCDCGWAPEIPTHYRIDPP